MRPAPYLLLVLSAHATAHPLFPDLRVRADTQSTATGKPRYPIVNVDGPDGDGDSDSHSPPTVTVTRHLAPTTITHRVTDTVTHTTLKPTTVIPVVPVDGTPLPDNDQDDSQPPRVTVTIWESDAATLASSETPSTTTSSRIVPPASITRPAIVDPEPEPTADFYTPPTTVSTEPVGESAAESSQTSLSPSFPASESPSYSSLRPIPSDIGLDDPESSTVVVEPATSPEPAPTPFTVTTESFAEWTPEPSPSAPPTWVEAPSQFISAEASSTISSDIAPSDVAEEVPPTPGSSGAASSSIVSFLSASSYAPSSTESYSFSPSTWSTAPTTFLTLTSSGTPVHEPETTSTQSHDDGYWHSSKYPGWNSTAPFNH